jgi:hypothetical protein
MYTDARWSESPFLTYGSAVLTIRAHFEPGQARPDHEPYRTGMGRDLEARDFFSRARSEMLFLVFLHYNMCGRPAQARARPETYLKIKARCV